MAKKNKSDRWEDDTQQIVINIPYQLASRTKKYALETGNTMTGVVIEALDALLMRSLKKA